jgi:hypothetical protein
MLKACPRPVPTTDESMLSAAGIGQSGRNGSAESRDRKRMATSPTARPAAGSYGA